jgi:hypothetical protein
LEKNGSSTSIAESRSFMLNDLIMDLNGTLGSLSNSSPMPQSSYRNGKGKRELKRALNPLLMLWNNHHLLDIR